ncbi:MAG: heme ABC transporter ATP-binding protein [Anaerolineaceae bacterium 4572_78]|nr:MAG: heme ABC transporter ATP-binding protein [Anaerolineaceae bacterium 4572_78]
MSNQPVVLEARNITKQFPGVLANDKVNLKLHKGEILALLGENGAGKSTLMNILYGLYRPNEGQVFVRGEQVEYANPRDAIAKGIGMVHQHFQLVPVFTVAENVILGSEVERISGVLDMKKAINDVRELSEYHGLPIDPTAIVEELPVGLQQRLEIIKALYRKAEILFLDEPTAVLTPQEVKELFEVMRGLVAQGKSIIFISHKLKEVLTICDRIAVMRAGKTVGEAMPAESTPQTLASLMVGRDVILQVAKDTAKPGEVVLQVNGLKSKDDRGQYALNGLDFQVKEGEIVGIAGVQGNGQTELVEVLTGLRRSSNGSVTVGGVDITNKSARFITKQKVSHIPEDRHRYGMVKSYSIADNLVLNSYYMPQFRKGLSLDSQAINKQAVDLIKEYDIRTPSAETSGGTLSGGNQQKMVVAREIGGRQVELLIASQPTRGVDVGSIEFIHSQIVSERDKGVAVLLVSAELDEIMALSDRIVVMYEGEIVDIVDAGQATREDLGVMMTGSK